MTLLVFRRPLNFLNLLNLSYRKRPQNRSNLVRSKVFMPLSFALFSSKATFLLTLAAMEENFSDVLTESMFSVIH